MLESSWNDGKGPDNALLSFEPSESPSQCLAGLELEPRMPTLILDFPYELEFSTSMPACDRRGPSVHDCNPFSGFDKVFCDAEIGQGAFGCSGSRLFRTRARSPKHLGTDLLRHPEESATFSTPVAVISAPLPATSAAGSAPGSPGIGRAGQQPPPSGRPRTGHAG